MGTRWAWMPEDATAKSANLVWAQLSQNDIFFPSLVTFSSVTQLGHCDTNLIPAADNHLLHTCRDVAAKSQIPVRLKVWRHEQNLKLNSLLLPSSDFPPVCSHVFLSNSLCIKCANVFESAVYCLSPVSIFSRWKWLSRKAPLERMKPIYFIMCRNRGIF